MIRPGVVQLRATRKMVKATAARRASRGLDHFSLMRASELGRDGETALSTEQRNEFFSEARIAGSSPAMTSER
jgi:hypothetical protein